MSEITPQDLFELILEVNKGTTDVLFRFSGHVDGISFWVYPRGYKHSERIDYGIVYLDDDPKRARAQISQMYSDLLEYL